MSKSGMFFFCEGDTEAVFYKALVDFLCKDITDDYRILNNTLGEEYYELKINNSYITIIYKSINTISSMTSSAPYSKDYYDKNQDIKNWTIFLCYDMDEYKNDITQFFEDDWSVFRDALSKNRENVEIIDLCARAEIEDLILLDINSICDYLKVSSIDVPTNSKGKGKLKSIFRKNNKCYHEGVRAAKLINTLDFNLIIKKAEIPLIKVKDSLLNQDNKN